VIVCDRCSSWFHIDCQGMSRRTYEDQAGKEFSWSCLTCGLPNLSSSFFTPPFSVSNSFSTLSQVESDGPDCPLLTSTPTRGISQRCKKHLKLLNLNCQSISSKKVEFQHIIDTTKPDIVCATETWLTPNHRDGEIGDPEEFPTNFNIFRKDRSHRRGGGVLLAVIKDILNVSEYQKLRVTLKVCGSKLPNPMAKIFTSLHSTATTQEM